VGFDVFPHFFDYFRARELFFTYDVGEFFGKEFFNKMRSFLENIPLN